MQQSQQSAEIVELLTEILLKPANTVLTGRFATDESAVCAPSCSGKCSGVAA